MKSLLKWANQLLVEKGRQLNNLSEDFMDGTSLILILEVSFLLLLLSLSLSLLLCLSFFYFSPAIFLFLLPLYPSHSRGIFSSTPSLSLSLLIFLSFVL